MPGLSQPFGHHRRPVAVKNDGLGVSGLATSGESLEMPIDPPYPKGFHEISAFGNVGAGAAEESGAHGGSTKGFGFDFGVVFLELTLDHAEAGDVSESDSVDSVENDFFHCGMCSGS